VTGELIDAEQACNDGLFNRLERGEALDAVLAFAEKRTPSGGDVDA